MVQAGGENELEKYRKSKQNIRKGRIEKERKSEMERRRERESGIERKREREGKREKLPLESFISRLLASAPLDCIFLSFVSPLLSISILFFPLSLFPLSHCQSLPVACSERAGGSWS